MYLSISDASYETGIGILNIVTTSSPLAVFYNITPCYKIDVKSKEVHIKPNSCLFKVTNNWTNIHLLLGPIYRTFSLE